MLACNGIFDSVALVLRRRGHGRIHVHASPAAIETYVPVDQSEDCVIATKPDVSSGQKFSTALAYDDVASHNHLAAEFFYTQPFADAVASVLNAALSFFMSHAGSLMFEG